MRFYSSVTYTQAKTTREALKLASEDIYVWSSAEIKNLKKILSRPLSETNAFSANLYQVKGSTIVWSVIKESKGFNIKRFN
jgi:hypothetical protein